MAGLLEEGIDHTLLLAHAVEFWFWRNGWSWLVLVLMLLPGPPQALIVPDLYLVPVLVRHASWLFMLSLSLLLPLVGGSGTRTRTPAASVLAAVHE